MSTENYLRGLDFDQLLQARRCADELIEQRSGEKRFGVWAVKGHVLTLRHFRETEYIEAAEALLVEARTLAQIEPKPFRRMLSLTYKLMPESEYSAHFEREGR